MKTLRNSKALAILGVLAVALVAGLAAAPSADAGCGGYGFGYASYHAPIATHYVAPTYHVAPVQVYKPVVAPTYYAPYYTPNCYYGW